MNTPETPLIVFFSILVGGGMTMVTMRVGVFYGGGGLPTLHNTWWVSFNYMKQQFLMDLGCPTPFGTNLGIA